MKAEEFDRKFDQGADVSAALHISNASRPEQEQRRVNLDFPQWMLTRLDKEANRLGVTREAVIKIWLSERLERSGSSESLHETH